MCYRPSNVKLENALVTSRLKLLLQSNLLSLNGWLLASPDSCPPLSWEPDMRVLQCYCAEVDMVPMIAAVRSSRLPLKAGISRLSAMLTLSSTTTQVPSPFCVVGILRAA